ncbi:MAG: hypothetical protein J6X84_07830 [Treponema sp.]|nr:hypothetical protein [Treponema sp.]
MNQKFHFTKRLVINIETDIDDKIPFEPEQVKNYLSFVSFFLKPMDMLKNRLGYFKAAPYLCLYLKFLSKIYSNAATIFRYCMTTTTRPKYYKTRKFRTIHFFDPHLLCAPSIHVAISAGTYAWFKQCFMLGIFDNDEAQEYLAEIKTQAIKIVESVLFVKQHSVNCVPLALYMLSTTMNKSFFTAQDATDFIESLFVNSPEIDPQVRNEILEHFFYMYDRTLLESRFCDEWQICIKHWLNDFAVQSGQNVTFEQEI